MIRLTTASLRRVAVVILWLALSTHGNIIGGREYSSSSSNTTTTTTFHDRSGETSHNAATATSTVLERETTNHYSQDREWVGADPLLRLNTGKIIYMEDFGGIPDSVFFGISHTKVSYAEFVSNDDDDEATLSSRRDHPSAYYYDDATSTNNNKMKSDLMRHGLTNRQAFSAALASAQPGDVVKVKNGEGYTLLGGVEGENMEHVTIDIAGRLFFLFSIEVSGMWSEVLSLPGVLLVCTRLLFTNDHYLSVLHDTHRCGLITYAAIPPNPTGTLPPAYSCVIPRTSP